MSKTVRTFALAVAAAVALALAGESAACTCGETTVEEGKQRADLVFAGTVARVDVVDPKDDWEPRIVVTFDVARVWKGDVGASVTLHTNYEASSCGGMFRGMLEENGPLLVYAYGRPASQWKTRSEGGAVGANSFTMRGPASEPENRALLDSVADDAVVYTTDICTRTQRVLYAVDDFDRLGDARELAPLAELPDRALVESMRPKFNEAPPTCYELTDAKVWRVLPEPPPNAARLVALIAIEPPTDPAIAYREYWFAATDARLGYCRTADGDAIVCGRTHMLYERDTAAPDGWKIQTGSVSTHCPALKKDAG